MPQAEKDAVLTPILRELCPEIGRHCPPYARFLQRLGRSPAEWQSLADVPPLPVAMFKQFLLAAVPPEKIVRELHSSSTTGQQPSRIVIDKTTAFRQARALAVDPQRAHRRSSPAVSGAGRGGVGRRGRHPYRPRRGDSRRGQLRLRNRLRHEPAARRRLVTDWPRIEDFFQRHGRAGVVVRFHLHRLDADWSRRPSGWGVKFHAPEAHTAAFRRMEKARRPGRVQGRVQPANRRVLGCDPRAILDFYGMVEQVGTVFVDCPAGNKHAPAFADVIIRRPLYAPAGGSRRAGHHRGSQRAAHQLSRPGADDRRPRRACGRGRLSLRPFGQLFPFHQPHRAGRGPRMRRHVRPIEGNPMSVLAAEKVTGTFCLKGPEGASHKRCLSPFLVKRARFPGKKTYNFFMINHGNKK